ncbi:MAG TPA: hypothetical protein VGA40_02580 [Candidatus Acidoferrales bacterium]
MESWVPFFVVVASAAIILQMGILFAMYLQMRDMNARITRVTTDLQTRVEPILTRVQWILDDSQGRIRSMVSDSAEIVHLARNQAIRVDRVFAEGVDRLRLQLIRADQLLTGAMEFVEDTGVQVRRTVAGPVKEASALIRGIQAGLEVIRGMRRSPERATREQPDEELFI